MISERHARVSELEACLDGEPGERVGEVRQDVLRERQLLPGFVPEPVPQHRPRRRGEGEGARGVVGQLGVLQELARLGSQSFGLLVSAPASGEQRPFAEGDHLGLRQREALGLERRLGE